MKIRKILLIVFVLLAMLSGFFLIRRNQYIASLALTPSSVGDVKVVVEEGSRPDTSKVKITFRTGISPEISEPISIVAFRLSTPLANAGTQIVDEEGRQLSQITPDAQLLDSENWEFPVNNFEIKDGKLIVDFSAVNKTSVGYSSSSYQPLATFNLAGVERDALDFEFDKELSVMYSKQRPVTNIWQNPDLSALKISTFLHTLRVK